MTQINAGPEFTAQYGLMKRNRPISILVAVILGSAALVAPYSGPNAADRAQWEAQLAEEALETLDCEVTFISHVVERALPDTTVIMAKAHCRDKRSFDAFRDSDMAPFTFKECTPREQQSC